MTPHIAEAIESKLDVDPVSGEEVEKIVAGLSKLIQPRDATRVIRDERLRFVRHSIQIVI